MCHAEPLDEDIWQDVGDSMEQKEADDTLEESTAPESSLDRVFVQCFTKRINRNKHERIFVVLSHVCIRVFTVWVVTGWDVQS